MVEQTVDSDLIYQQDPPETSISYRSSSFPAGLKPTAAPRGAVTFKLKAFILKAGRCSVRYS